MGRGGGGNMGGGIEHRDRKIETQDWVKFNIPLIGEVLRFCERFFEVHVLNLAEKLGGTMSGLEFPWEVSSFVKYYDMNVEMVRYCG